MSQHKSYRNFKEFTEKDLINHYHQNYGGYTRMKLREEDEYFYKLLFDKDLINGLIPDARKNKKRKYGDLSDLKLFELLEEKYPNATRGSGGIEAALLKEFKKRDIVKKIPTEFDLGLSRHWKGMSVRGLRKFYLRNYRDKSPTETSIADSGFYKHLSRIGKIHQVIRN